MLLKDIRILMSDLNGRIEDVLTRVRQYIDEREMKGRQGNPEIIFLGYYPPRTEDISEIIERANHDEFYRQKNLNFVLRDLAWVTVFGRSMQDYDNVIIINPEDF